MNVALFQTAFLLPFTLLSHILVLVFENIVGQQFSFDKKHQNCQTTHLCKQLLQCKCQLYLLFENVKKEKCKYLKKILSAWLFWKRRRACGQLRHEAGSGGQLILPAALPMFCHAAATYVLSCFPFHFLVFSFLFHVLVSVSTPNSADSPSCPTYVLSCSCPTLSCFPFNFLVICICKSSLKANIFKSSKQLSSRHLQEQL